MPKVLVVDDEPGVRRSISIILRKSCDVITAASGDEATGILKSESIDLVLLDIRLPEKDGLKVLGEIKKIDENMVVIMITALKDAKTAVEAMKLGAYDYITKPFDVSELRALVDKALEKAALIKENLFLKIEMAEREPFHEIVGQGRAIGEIFDLIDKAAKTDIAVLISGESGTGKELTARAIHFRSIRTSKPFVVMNCAAVPENLLESELFGYERGAFTGAFENKKGKFEIAGGGTIFLDEICSMSMPLQAKMLRVLQPRADGLKEIERIGAGKSMAVDVRIISATNRDLKKEVEQGRFREDLFFRLNVLPINIPPLRERKEDIPLLVDYFLKKHNKKLNKSIGGISGEVRDLFVEYRWPGNVRELGNLIERLVTLGDGGAITIDKLPVEIFVDKDIAGAGDSLMELSLKKAKEQLERQFIKRALGEARGNQSKAAKLLGLHRNTLFLKLSQLGMDSEEKNKSL